MSPYRGGVPPAPPIPTVNLLCRLFGHRLDPAAEGYCDRCGEAIATCIHCIEKGMREPGGELGCAANWRVR